jgi:hypothetical protein
MAAEDLAAIGVHRPSAGTRTAAGIMGALKRAIRDTNDVTVRKLYDVVLAGSTIEYVIEFLRLLGNDPTLDRERAHAIAKWFAEEAPDVEPVRWALATLGVMSHDERELLSTLGRHEAFAFYAVNAARVSVSEPDRLIWELARHHDGWDRVHAIMGLAGTTDAEIMFANSAMQDGSSWVCIVCQTAMTSYMRRP